MKNEDVIISLLARMVFGEECIKKFIITNKRNPLEWIKGYNACDGMKGVGEIAKIVKVAQPTATVMLKAWEDKGIVFNAGTESKPQYKKLLRLSMKK